MRHTSATVNGERGFTLLEILLVLAIGGTLMAMVFAVSPSFIRHSRAEAGVTQVIETLRTARDMAITQRRNVSIVFNGTDIIQVVRQNIPTGTTVLQTVRLENRVQFLRVAGLPDTPNLLGNVPAGAAVAFGPSLTRLFTSEGTLVDSNGDVLNGTLFLAIPGQVNSARAITVFGTTGLMRLWKWNGTQWLE